MRLQHGHTMIHVHDPSQHAITFGVDQTIHIGIRIVNDPDILSVPVSFTELLFPEVLADPYLDERKNTDGDGAGGIMSGAEILVFIRIHIHEVAFLHRSANLLDRSREDPGMKT